MGERSVKLIYFAYLGSLGLMVTYWPYHFSALGFTAFQIGLIFSVRTLLAIGAQPFFTAWADRIGRPLGVLKLSLGTAFLIACGLPFATSFLVAAVLIWIQTPLQTSTLPLLDVRTYRIAGASGYGPIRLWGSVGYGVCVLGFGLLVRELDDAAVGYASVWAYLALALLGVLAISRMKEDPRPDETARPQSILRLLRSWRLLLFLAANALHWGSIMIFNVFLALLVQERGMSAAIPGIAVAVSIVGEVVAFRWASRFIAAEQANRWMPLIAMVGVVRWVLTAMAMTPAVLVLVQGLHLISFGLWYYFAMSALGRYGAPEDRGALQGVFAAASLGLGASLGTIGAGWIADMADVGSAFLLAAGFELVAGLLFVAVLIVERRHDVAAD